MFGSRGSVLLEHDDTAKFLDMKNDDHILDCCDSNQVLQLSKFLLNKHLASLDFIRILLLQSSCSKFYFENLCIIEITLSS